MSSRLRNLWSPWRSEYLERNHSDASLGDCPFCPKDELSDGDSLIVHRGERCLVVMNLYPYNAGHVMVMPTRHVADLTELEDDESRELHELIVESIAALRDSFEPEGFNVGLNLGAAAGAGIQAHLHWHVVPRWAGDTNFMPTLAETKVVSQRLEETRGRLADAFRSQS